MKRSQDYPETDYTKIMPHSHLWFVNQNPYVLRKIEELAKQDEKFKLVPEEELNHIKIRESKRKEIGSNKVKSRGKLGTTLPKLRNTSLHEAFF